MDRMDCARIVLVVIALATAACGGSKTPEPQTAQERGVSEYRACAVCHARTDPADPATPRLIGPSLYGVAGAPAARLQDYDYSPAMRRAGLTWDDATLSAFIANPQGVVPGTRMSYAGEPDPNARAAIITYLKTLR
jgi:cytochrome c